MMQYFFYALSAVCSLYSIVIFVRIIMSWFPERTFGRFYSYLCGITDPYLNWFRRFNLNFIQFDLSPLFAIIVLNVASTTFSRLAQTGHISIGFLLALVCSMIGSVATFVVGFYIILMILRLLAYSINADIHKPFWRIIDYISRPVSYHIGRLFFRGRTGSYAAGLIVSIIALVILYIVLSVLFITGESLLKRLPF